ncbi:MAG: UDP-N-acetylmuramoyl-L-alanine--D-glutamate ligase [Desulfosarcinaceae bacterium]
MDLNARNIVVVGLARSGLSAAQFLKARGARVTITDQTCEDALGAAVQQARELGVGLEIGGHQAATLDAADLIVISPGVPHTLSLFQEARERGVPVIGEIELASRFIQKPIVAVTGTNGKTTTTELLGRMLAGSGLQVFVGGNIGNPLIQVVGRETGLDVIVVEVSSFQLDTIETFRPHVGVLLNITPDHLDRYPDMQAYIASKGRLFMNQLDTDFAICNGNDASVQKQCRQGAGHLYNFYSHPPLNGAPGQGAIITPCQVAVHAPGLQSARFSLAHTALIGPHNRENIAAAILAALAVGGGPQAIQDALDTFQAPAHRMEPVGEVRGVRFVNDSKATNVDAVIRALECFETPVVLILGGRNKGYDFTRLGEQVRRRVRRLVAIGEAGDEIIRTLGRLPAGGAERAGDMAQAVKLAFDAAQKGDTVLLSPACASFDMFANYAERGETFRRLVRELL